VTAAQFEDREGRDLVEAILKRVDNRRIDLDTPGVRYAPTAPFDYDAPLPDLHIRKARSWEPAARHYRDLNDDEKNGTGTL
jgi:hypothetical protein